MWIKFKGNIQICSRWARASWKGGRSRQKVHWVLAKVTAFLQKEHLGMRNAKKNFFSTYLESAYSDEMTKDDWVSCFRRRGVYNGKLSSGISVSSESDSFNSAIFFHLQIYQLRSSKNFNVVWPEMLLAGLSVWHYVDILQVQISTMTIDVQGKDLDHFGIVLRGLKWLWFVLKLLELLLSPKAPYAFWNSFHIYTPPCCSIPFIPRHSTISMWPQM